MFMVYRRKSQDGTFLMSPAIIGVWSRYTPAKKQARMISAEMPGVNVFVKEFGEGAVPNPDGEGAVPFIGINGEEWTPDYAALHAERAAPDLDDDLPF